MKKYTKLAGIGLALVLALTFSNPATVHAMGSKESASVTITTHNGAVETIDGDYLNKEAYKTFEAVNELRAQKGLAPLKWANELDELGRQRAVEIQDYFEHERPDGSPRTIVKDGKVIVTGENIAMNYVDCEDVMTGWTNSSGHYKNMTRASYKSYYCACFVTYDPFWGWPTYTWVQLFSFEDMGTSEPQVAWDDESGSTELADAGSSSSNAGQAVEADTGDTGESEEVTTLVLQGSAEIVEEETEIIVTQDPVEITEGGTEIVVTQDPVEIAEGDPVVVVTQDPVVTEESKDTEVVVTQDPVVVKEEGETETVVVQEPVKVKEDTAEVVTIQEPVKDKEKTVEVVVTQGTVVIQE